MTIERQCFSADKDEIAQHRLESQDTHYVARAQWMVDHVVFLGAVRDISGDFVNVLAFRSGLRTGKTSREIELRVDTRVLVQLLKRIGPGAIRSPRTITKVIEDLLVGALSSRNCGFDPLRVSQWEWEKQRWPSYHAITFHKPYRGLALS